ncbi:MAG: hypothetical protein GY866_40670 [Proteobacteria bacterium]|nr:hypothetical protein [Pseudomonadota bacterium]
MRKTSLLRKRRKKSISFNPNHEFVNEAIKDYIRNGGRITKIEEFVEDDLDRFRSYL